jgi:hypothetical protein
MKGAEGLEEVGSDLIDGVDREVIGKVLAGGDKEGG